MTKFFLSIVEHRPRYCAWLVLASGLLVVPTAAAQRRAPPANAPLAVSFDRILAPVYPRDRPGAAVIVVKNGQVVYRKAFGLANLELKTPMRPEMVFRLCSVTKQFTAAAIIMLVEAGKLNLSDDITKFFPDYPTDGKKITVENLLTHTSGIPDYINKIWPARIGEPFTPNELIELFKHEHLEFEPGTKEGYSNANYILLGAIIEQLSGQNYGTFINERIFKPLGMTRSVYERNQELLPGRVSGYLQKEGRYINAAFYQTSQLYAAGALDSTVDDLARWDAAIGSDRLLKHSSWVRIFTPFKLAKGQTSAYGFGWAISEFQGHPVASHAGGVPGFRAYVMRLAQDHVYVALLSNDETTETQPELIVHRLAGIAIGKPVIEPKVIRIAATALEQFVGEYQDGDEKLTIRRDGDRLFARSSPDPEVELFPVSAEKFIIKAFDATLTFTKDKQGHVTGVIESAGGQSGTLKKIK
jgi:CubicO group peptidase (beta-lactamase class C family)